MPSSASCLLSPDSSPSQPHASFGFTLLEVLVALAILAVSCAAVIKAVVTVQDTFLQEQSRQTAVMLGAGKLAEIELNGPDGISLWSGGFEGYPEYRWAVDVSQPGEADLLTKVVLRVHQPQGGRELAVFERLYFTPPE